MYETDRELITRAQEGDQDARDQLLARYDDAMRSVIAEYIRAYGSIDMPRRAVAERLRAEADRLLDEYRLDRDAALGQWLPKRLSEHLENYLRSREGGVALPEDLEVDRTQVESARRTLEGNLEREPTAQEVSDYMEESVGRTMTEGQARRLLDEDEEENGTVRASEPSVGLEASIGRQYSHHEEALKDALRKVDETSREVFAHSFGLFGREELSLEQLAQKLDLPVDEVRSLIEKTEQVIRENLVFRASDAGEE